MGCFSFLCKVSGKPALSTSFDGSPVYLFLLKDGVVIEEMYGNYDSYGRVFDGKGGSFEWKMKWRDVCNLMFSDDHSNGIAVILAEYYTSNLLRSLHSTTRSEDDPNQGWGDPDDEDENLMGNCSDNMFPKVENPYHVVFRNLSDSENEEDE